MKRLFAATVCVVGLLASAPAQAASILVTTTDGVIGTFAVDFVGGTTATTITGVATADIVDGVVVNSGVVDADTPPTSNDALFFDLVDEALLFDFNLASSAGLGTPLWQLLVSGSGLTTITDPSLAEFLAPNNIGLFSLLGEPVFTFNDQGAPLSAVFTYTLESITAAAPVQPVPEPATIGLVGMGILAAARSRRTRRAKNAA